MTWSYFSENGTGALHNIEGNMNTKTYSRRIESHWPRKGIWGEDGFQQDNNPKHTVQPKGQEDLHMNLFLNVWRILTLRGHESASYNLGELPSVMDQNWSTMLKKANYFLPSTSWSCNCKQQLCNKVLRLVICGVQTFFTPSFFFVFFLNMYLLILMNTYFLIIFITTKSKDIMCKPEVDMCNGNLKIYINVWILIT